ncbi:MAG: SCP2 sterol-binding domain-containing protein [Dethiobacteria bacterium]|nr:SCP2 sterol-binding domain-containing protein [Bacillota bacterium]MDW7730019.1 SCP2 sterol-binding domain-containing protein [Bacillota bacterium]
MAYVYGTDQWETAYKEMTSERMASVSKPYVMGSPEWVGTFEKLIQEDDHYKEVAKTWEGTVVIHILANPENGLDDDIYMLMDLWHGDCRSVRLVPKEEGESANFVLTGELERWQSVMKKELDVVKAMMQGKVKLKGSLPTIVRYVKASIRLVDLAAQVGTVFQPEMNEQELEEYKKSFGDLRATFGF